MVARLDSNRNSPATAEHFSSHLPESGYGGPALQALQSAGEPWAAALQESLSALERAAPRNGDRDSAVPVNANGVMPGTKAVAKSDRHAVRMHIQEKDA